MDLIRYYFSVENLFLLVNEIAGHLPRIIRCCIRECFWPQLWVNCEFFNWGPSSGFKGFPYI
ncbi:hypothetical protein DVK01_11885 [Haloarcula sp. Atlit-120R]|nr:hypothetical protein DVK01_11885 [Haloarcula sp. Atlit-120R]